MILSPKDPHNTNTENPYILKSNQTSVGYKSFRTLAPTIWNTLPAEIQALTKLDEFKTNIDKIYFSWCSWQKCCDNGCKAIKQAQHIP